MNNDELVKIFNPANAGTLSQEDLAIFRDLSDEQIGILAKAYPNSPSRRPYLILYDKNVKPEKQLFSLSTFQNLYNVRKFSNLKNFVPYDFKSAVFPVKTRTVANVSRVGNKAAAVAPGKKILVDLSANEAANELKSAIGDAPPPPADKKSQAPVVNMEKKPAPSANPAQDAIDKALKKSTGSKKVVTEKTTPVTRKARGKVTVDVSKPAEPAPGNQKEPGATQE